MVALADAYGHSTLTFGNASPSSNILERNSLTLVTMCWCCFFRSSDCSSGIGMGVVASLAFGGGAGPDSWESSSWPRCGVTACEIRSNHWCGRWCSNAPLRSLANSSCTSKWRYLRGVEVAVLELTAVGLPPPPRHWNVERCLGRKDKRCKFNACEQFRCILLLGRCNQTNMTHTLTKANTILFVSSIRVTIGESMCVMTNDSYRYHWFRYEGELSINTQCMLLTVAHQIYLKLIGMLFFDGCCLFYAVSLRACKVSWAASSEQQTLWSSACHL